MIRFGAFDLDGTLIDRDEQPYPGVEAALQSLRERGVRPILITGRGARSFRNLGHLSTLFDQLDDEVLLSEGNVRLRRSTDDLSLRAVCSEDALDRLGSVPSVELVAELSGDLFATSRRAAMQFAMAYRLPRQQIELMDTRELSARGATSVTVFADRSWVAELLAGLAAQLVTIGPFAATVVRPQGTSKAVALRDHLRARFGEPDLSTTLAVGDDEGDADLLRTSALGVATSDAHPAAVEAAAGQVEGDLATFLRGFVPARRDHAAGSGLRARTMEPRG